MNKPDKNDFEEWKNHPVTQWAFEEIRRAKAECSESMISGSTLHSNSAEKTALFTAGLIGFVDGLNELIKLEDRIFK